MTTLENAIAAIDSATAILKADNDEAALIAKVRFLQAATEHLVPGTRLHCANIRLCDAIAALDAFRARRDDPQGFEIGYYRGE